jgi:outer membrane protein
MCIAACGCAVDQPAEVDEYRRITDIAAPEPFAQGEPLGLMRALRLAGAYNEDLGIAGEQYLRLVIERQRRVADLLPTLDLFGDLALRENTGAGRVAAFDAGLGARYAFPTGLGDRRALAASEIDIDAGRWALIDVREGLLLEAARAYYEVLRAERLIAVLEASVAVQEERLRDIRGRQEVGFARPLDVAQIDAQASATKVLLIEARSAAILARSALTFATGVEAGASELIDGLELPAGPLAAEDLLAQARMVRGDLLATRADAAAARERVDAALSQYAPTIGVNLDWFLLRETSPDDLDIASLISINLPLFSAGRIDADVRAAWSVFRESVLRHQGTRRQVRFEVEAALNDFETSRLRMAELVIQVAAARETLRQAEATYAAGRGTNLERVQAQADQTEAEVRLASEEFTLKLAYLTLRRAMGMLAVDAGAAPTPPGAGEEYPVPESPFVRVAPAG